MAPRTALVLGAFAVTWFVWGSTYLAYRFAVQTVPPLFMVAVRCLLAGAILYGGARLVGGAGRLPWRQAALPGTLLFGFGHGALAVGLTRVPSGSAALVEATIPIWLVLLAWALGVAGRPSTRVVLGLLGGLAGVAILVGPEGFLPGRGLDPLGTAAVLVSAVTWALGSLIQRRSPALAGGGAPIAAQLIFGGSVALLASAVLGEPSGLSVAAFAPAQLAAIAYLVAFGSILGFVSYTWLLRQTTPARVGSYAYVNPLVAVALGWLVAGEEISYRTVVAALVTILGVVLVLVPPRSRATDVRRPQRTRACTEGRA